MSEHPAARSTSQRYVLVTTAYNEERYIERAIKSVIAQTVRPVKWIIASDGSTDRTDDIVGPYAEVHDFIELHRITEEHRRNFAAQVIAINIGFTRLKNSGYDFIGNLDADISLEPGYFGSLLDKFARQHDLGLAGGYILEDYGSGFTCRKGNTLRSVPHGVQFFRRKCLEDIGGKYLPLPYGGPDTHAEVCARMRGWRVRSFPDLAAYHHRSTGTADGRLRYAYRQGFMDFSLGAHPVFEVAKLARRLARRPYVLGSCARMAGFSLAYLRGGAGQ